MAREHPATQAMLGLVKTLQGSVRRSRTAQYCARLDEHMRTMDRDASLAFLRGELTKWIARYERFQMDLLAGEPLTSDVTAWDYAETIGVLGVRIARLERQVAA